MARQRRGSGFAGAIARVRSLVHGLLRRGEIESAMREEFRHHIEMRAADLERGGMSWKDAVRRAHIEFGHEETHRENARAARGLHLLDRIGFSWLDVRLGVRMLLKHPAMTAVALFALAAGIPVGMAPQYVANVIEAPLPEDHANRIRAIRLIDPTRAGYASPTYEDYARWSERSTTFERLAGFRGSSYAMATGDAASVAVSGAEVTASVFDLLATPPVMGRVFDRGDEAIGAQAVAVIGTALWESRFAADPDILDRNVDIAGVSHRIVGVMPESFEFPDRQQLWVPLHEETSANGIGLGLRVIGRLARGETAERAQAELRAIGRERLEVSPGDPGIRREAEVVPWPIGSIGLPKGGMDAIPGFTFFRVLALALLLVASANVAMLVFARTVTRFRELAVRTALGASRSRIIAQIFVETAVLAALAAGVGVVSIAWALGRLRDAMALRFALPYWLDVRITRETILAAQGLAVVSAVVAGVVPALRVTGRRISESIRRADAGRAGIRFGGVTGALIVLDVAIVVIVSGFVTGLTERIRDVTRTEELVGIPAGEYLAADLRMPIAAMRTASGALDSENFVRHFATAQRTLIERLEAEPAVRSVTFADALPRQDTHSLRIEVEATGVPGQGRYVRAARVDVDFFRALDRPVGAGRGFSASDPRADPPPVIVNTVFVERFLEGRAPLGQRVRLLGPDGSPGPWREIVGVVGHLGLNMVNPAGDAGLYLPAAAGDIHPVRIAIHLGPDPETFAPRLREIVAGVDASLVLGDPIVLDRVFQGDWYIILAVGAGLALLIVVLVALATSGLYAMLAFSVAQRTREIGIRTALGAQRGTMILLIVRRSLAQIAIGAMLGLPVAARILHAIRREASREVPAALSIAAALVIASCLVLVIGVLSGFAPVRRALRITPSVALNAET